MAIKRFAGDKFSGLSSDTKPANVLIGATFWETNTSLVYQYDGTDWEEIAYVKPGDLGLVATSNDYNDLDNLPDLTALESRVEQYTNLAAFPATGDEDVFYIAKDTGYLYRWTGAEYVQLTDQTAVWGSISGTLSDQTDLNNALNDRVLEANKASTAEAEAGTDDTKWMTPLKTKQAIDEFAGAAGEANTASNVGAGSGVFKEKVGVDLRFKSLVGGDNVTLDTTDPDEIKIDASGGATAAGAAGDVQFNDGAANLAADAAFNYDNTDKELGVPDLRITESGQTNTASANDNVVVKVTTEDVGGDTVVRFMANLGNGQDVIIASYIDPA